MTDLDVDQLRLTVLWLSFALSCGLGAVMQRTHFCTLGAVADWVNMGDLTRMRMWLFAIAVAIIGTGLLTANGVIDSTRSLYTGPKLLWLSNLTGGLCFGVGMVLASGCGSKTLVRIGGGSLKSLVVFLVMGLTAYMTLRGVLSMGRTQWLDPVMIDLGSGQDLPRWLMQRIPQAGGIDLSRMQGGLSLCIGLALILLCLFDRHFRQAEPLMGGLGVGLCVVAGWLISGHLGYLAENPLTLEESFIGTNSGRIESFSFVAPTAYALELLMLWSDSTRVMTIGITSVIGMITGSAIVSLITGRFQWEAFRGVDDMTAHLLGGALMGFGGVTAVGCTIGQGLSGLSTLALGSLLVFGAVIAGGWLGIQWQVWRLERSAT
ncbi:MAG: YeeE/YedE family protein [Betaproteobacteria bacterium]|nr:YeeE/YedE family protein [Betaproteobacteria bacterium]